MEDSNHSMKPLELLQSKKLTTICAPMVRYSKLPFRTLVRKYGCDLCFTPMIISDSFIKSNKARHSDFTTTDNDHPLIVQFAASNSHELSTAATLVSPYCEGVDLNCGCPQRWAMAEGYGACLIHKPELVADMVRKTRNAITDTDFTISIKIRLHSDNRKSVDFARQMEAAGISFLTVHGRTVNQKNCPVSLSCISDIKQAVSIPVIANGDVKSIMDCNYIQEETNIDGIMSARGILANPAFYAGHDNTPLECITDWVRIALETGLSSSCFHHHLIYMMDSSLSKAERQYFNILGSTSSIVTFLREKYKIDI